MYLKTTTRICFWWCYTKDQLFWDTDEHKLFDMISSNMDKEYFPELDNVKEVWM